MSQSMAAGADLDLILKNIALRHGEPISFSFFRARDHGIGVVEVAYSITLNEKPWGCKTLGSGFCSSGWQGMRLPLMLY